MLTSCTWFLSIMLNLLSFLILTICNSKGMNETERSYGSTFQSTVKEKITVFISFLFFFFLSPLVAHPMILYKAAKKKILEIMQVNSAFKRTIVTRGCK